MYKLQSFDGTYALITDDAQPYNAKHLATSEADAVTIVNALNATYTLPLLATYRYNVETGGIVINGMNVYTDRESQAQLNGAFQALSNGFVSSVDWKTVNGWINVTLGVIQPIAKAVALHVQRCFTAEKNVTQQITAGMVATTDVISAFDTALKALAVS